MEVFGNILLIIVSIGTFVSYLPQIIKCLKTKKCDDLSVWSWIIWGISSLSYVLYAVLCQNNLMLIFQAVLELIFCLIILVCAIVFRKKKLMYNKKDENKI